MPAHILLQSLLNTLEDGACIVEPDGRLRMLNNSAARLLDDEVEDLAGRTVSDALAPAPERVAISLSGFLASDKIRQEDVGEFRRKDRAPLMVSYTADRIRLDEETDGILLRFRPALAALSCDIALHESEIKLRLILDTIVDGVVAADSKGTIQVFNPAAERLFGYSQEEVVGRNVNMLMPSPDHEAHDSYLANYLTTGVRKIIGIGREVNGKRKDGNRVPVYLSVGEALLGRERMFVAVLHDLTEKKRAEARLLTLSRAVEQSLNAIMITSVDGMVEYVNPSFTRLTGYAAEEILGRTNPPGADLHSPEGCRAGQPGMKPSPPLAVGTSDQADAAMQAALRGGGEWQGEIQDRKKTGELYWALRTISPIRNAAGEIMQYLMIQQDISELKREKEALQESEARFRQVAEMTGEWLWEQDPAGRYIYSSGAVQDILGYEPQEILGKNYLDLLTPQDRERWSHLPAPESHHRFTRVSNRYLHRDGHEVYTESTGDPIFDADGKLAKWRGVDHNVTHRKLYEDALRLRDRAIEAASVGIVITDARDPDHPTIYVNPALLHITGYSREELLGSNMRILQGPDTDTAAVRGIGAAMSEGRACEVVLKNYRKDGTPFWNELRISPVRGEDGALTHFIGIQTDVTELRHASEERHELEIAKQIQLSLLPKRPLGVEGVKVAGVCLPATHIGGDYFDYFYTGRALDVVIADVSGHSVGAALIMAEVRSALKAETRSAASGHNNNGPAKILSLLNEVLFEDLSGADLFISMFYLRLDLATRRLSYANAGHNCPLLSRASAAVCDPLDADGLILGVKKIVFFEEKSLQIETGDRLLLYTDGVTEALNEEGEFFDVPRLCDLFSMHRDARPEIVIGRLIEALHEFRGAVPLEDDVSMAVISME